MAKKNKNVCGSEYLKVGIPVAPVVWLVSSQPSSRQVMGSSSPGDSDFFSVYDFFISLSFLLVDSAKKRVYNEPSSEETAGLKIV